jgi:hypothetical protein
MIIKKFKIFESLKSSDEEYYDAILNHYDEDLLSKIKQGDQMAKSMLNSEITTEKTDGENLIIRYIENRNTIIILGAVSKTGKLNKGDIIDLNKWIEEASNKLIDGYTIMTSTNQLSKPLIDKIIKKVENKGFDVNIQKMDSGIRYNDIRWDNLTINIE